MRLSPKEPWKLETDARVEDNGTVFLVHPYTDLGRDWLANDKNLPSGSRRLGDIVVVERRCVLRLVTRMIADGHLRVVWH